MRYREGRKGFMRITEGRRRKGEYKGEEQWRLQKRIESCKAFQGISENKRKENNDCWRGTAEGINGGR